MMEHKRVSMVGNKNLLLQPFDDDILEPDDGNNFMRNYVKNLKVKLGNI